MKKTAAKLLLICLGIVSTVLLYQTDPANRIPEPDRIETNTQTGLQAEKPERAENKQARAEYFFKLLRDPVTDAIPSNIRSRELDYARQLPDRRQYPLGYGTPSATRSSLQFNWQSEGPFDVGGRSRALVVDQRDSSVIYAGGVSGGVWKSEDEGATWQLKTDITQNFSVSTMEQHPIDPDTLYYASGEFIGNSASDRGSRAFYFGTGVYRSTDGGESWNQLPAAADEDNEYDSEYDFISRIAISPTTGTILISSNGFGIYRSTDGETFSSSPVLGTEAEQQFCDVAVASDGTFIATISESTFGSGNHNPGVFISNDDGQSWSEVTPSTFPANHRRSVVAFAPSNPDIAYVLTHVSTSSDDIRDEDIRLHQLNFAANTSDDRSDNIPDFGGNVGSFWTQRGYDMVISVKPDDENFVLIGGTNLFRSTDGFSTEPADTDGDGITDSSEKDKFWIGGYSKDNDFSQYPGQHPDQHIIAFDPNNPNRMWAGHDGGLSLTEDVTASSVSWSDKNDGYITTQFYTTAIPDAPSDDRIMGGTQDNGTPFFRTSDQQSQNPVSSDISFGDGGYAYFTGSHIFVSRQFGEVVRYSVDASGNPDQFAFVHPANAGNQLFIHPYVVDPNDENVMYYPGGRSIWRNTSIDDIPNNNQTGGVEQGWSSFDAVPNSPGYQISTLEISLIPSDVLYYAASIDEGAPKLFKLRNARSSTNIENISIDTAPSGAYVHDIAIDPANADDALVVLSNYNIPSIYYTNDGGDSWTSVEGNLSGSASNPGPSVRSATIIPAEGGDIYVAGTSTGVFSTDSLAGSNTQWVRESPGGIGFAVSEYVTSRVTDGNIAIGTHGRGIFTGSFQGNVTIPTITMSPNSGQVGEQVTIQSNNFSFSSDLQNIGVFFGDTPARITDGTSSSLTVEVPRRIKKEESTPSTTVGVTIERADGSRIAGASFTYLPPDNFTLLQNYPNPFNPTTNIPFDLNANSFVIIQIYNSIGRKVKEPVSEPFQAGSWVRTVNLSNLASGVYFYRVLVFPQQGNQFSRTPQIIKSRKMTLVK